MPPNLKVLRGTGARRIGVIKGVTQIDTGQRHLLYPVDFVGRGNAGGLVDRRDNIYDMMKLGTQTASVLDLFRPGNDHAVARTAEMRRHPFHPLKR